MFIEVFFGILFCSNNDEVSGTDNVVSGVGSLVVGILPVTPTARVQFPVTAVIFLYIIAILVFIYSTS